MTVLSVQPPSALICVNRSASAWLVSAKVRHFAINILSIRRRSIADRFAGRGGIKGEAWFQEGDWTRLITGAPVLNGALAILDCETEEMIDRHSHTILISRVKAIRGDDAAGVLLYWRGGYSKLDEALQHGAGIRPLFDKDERSRSEENSLPET
ncbi:flavin reductase family protein (plasmid) [Microvirga sp. RSM25]|uniref:flavin reductase family protein n=1 Tax=Microvirga sp. RSM25 TaxID=3273802 RepID=UPI00384A85FE